MSTNIQIPKELLAQADFNNTVNGGMAYSPVMAWCNADGYRLTINAPSIDNEAIIVEAANQRFMVYYMIDVLGGEEQMPYFLVNLPLLPDVDVKSIKARFENGQIHIFAPFNDWAKGDSRHIAFES